MIVHNIITHKPVTPLPQQQQRHYPAWTLTEVPRSLPFNFTNKDVEEYLAEAPIHLGDFVVSKMISSITGLYSVHFVMSVDKVNSLTMSPTSWERGHPCIYRMLQMWTSATTPWIRNESYVGYRKLSEAEFNE